MGGVMKEGGMRSSSPSVVLTVGGPGGDAVPGGWGGGAVHHDLPLGTLAGTPVDGAGLVQVHSVREEEVVVKVVLVWRRRRRGNWRGRKRRLW